jgi:hypothetical protein
LTAPLPHDELEGYDDIAALRMNADLDGSVRVARMFGERVPHIRADVPVEQLLDLDGWVQTACDGLTGAAHLMMSRTRDDRRGHRPGARTDRSRPGPLGPGAPLRIDDVVHCCRDAGWPVAHEDATQVRVEIATRGGVHHARFDESAHAPARFVVELTDLTGQPDVCRRAVAAMLLAVSGSVRSAKGGVLHREEATLAVLISAPHTWTASSVDDSLSALAAACQISGREVVALLDERLAAQYLALACGADAENTKEEVDTYVGAGLRGGRL